MKKLWLLIPVAAVIGLAYLLTRQPAPVEAPATEEEAAAEIEQAETDQEAADIAVQQIDQEFSAEIEEDFAADDLSDEALGL